MALQEGEHVGPYIIGARLGAGGMGEVHRAMDTRLGREVALKVLRDEHAGDAAHAGRLEREARAAAALNHPNIVAVFDVGTHDGAPYLVTELLEGDTLRGLLAAPVPLDRAVTLATQLAAGLSAAHERGIVHRDLKPENLFVTRDGRLKILDFGIARVVARESVSGGTVTEGTATGALLGTVGYMAPEQVRGLPADARADAFAFGCVLYELLSGERAFRGATPVETAYAILNFEPPALPPGTPAHLVALVKRCLSKSANERPTGGAELEQALSGRPLPAIVPPRTRSRVWPYVVAPLIVATALGGYRLWDTQRPRTMTSYPPPKGLPEAVRLYTHGLEYLRSGRWNAGWDLLRQAVATDHDLAAAHLRLAAYPWATPTLSERRQHLAAAVAHADALDDRDKVILAWAQALDAQQDAWTPEKVRPLVDALADAFPHDAELRLLTAHALFAVSPGSQARQLVQLQRALEIDPEFATVWSFQGSVHTDLHEYDAALEDYRRCLAVAPGAIACVRGRTWIEIRLGQCAQFESDARAAIKIEPDLPEAHEMLARALASNGASVESVKVAFDRWVSLTPEGPKRRLAELSARVRLAELAGDFTDAEAGLREVELARAGDPEQELHDLTYATLMELAREQGDAPLALADEFERKRTGWQDSGMHWVQLRKLLLDEAAGRISHAEVVARREKLNPDLSRPDATTEERWLGWIWQEACYATTDEQLEAALQHRPTERQSSTLVPTEEGLCDARVLEHAGRWADAITAVRAITSSCYVVPEHKLEPWTASLVFMRAHVQLGRALEATNDTRGACDAYRVVRERWKNAKPRSVTLEVANERFTALGCR
jgi:serine/threonine-protein kinase